ncbi:hypothetical protein JZK55_13680 [Dissulfurispira thermophila]|uniref:Uncharacterized protein n=1 Tax=Dissulfurispira thermophila TaxID=2715679 RepID=A0A7G1H3C6_9BACT|nr:hypothetical protein [Dissulfurispira thermophila]BCB96446.1 hypothetical protein JZK55_13680 [Dissulfurispira thermophila]
MSEYFTKKDAEEFKEDIKRYLGILAEDFQHKLGFVIDNQMDIKREVEGLKVNVDRLEQRMDGLEQRMDRLEQRMDGLEQKVDMIHVELVAHRDNTEVHVQQVKKRRRQ